MNDVFFSTFCNRLNCNFSAWIDILWYHPSYSHVESQQVDSGVQRNSFLDTSRYVWSQLVRERQRLVRLLMHFSISFSVFSSAFSFTRLRAAFRPEMRHFQNARCATIIAKNHKFLSSTSATPLYQTAAEVIWMTLMLSYVDTCIMMTVLFSWRTSR